MSEPSDSPYPLATPQTAGEDGFDLQTAAELSGMHPEMILEFHRSGVVAITGFGDESALRFGLRDILRLRQIEALRHEGQMSVRAIRLVVTLMDRLESAEAELRVLRERVR